MSRQKSVYLNQTIVNKLHLQKQTLKIKNVGLKHQLSVLKSELQSLIIKCKELSRVRQNLYCLLEKAKIEKLTPINKQTQYQRQNMLKQEIDRLKQQIKNKGQMSIQLSDEHQKYIQQYNLVMKNLTIITNKISATQEELELESIELKQIKQINFDLQKMKRVLQEEKDTTIAFQLGSKTDHQQFSQKYSQIIQKLMNDRTNIQRSLQFSQKKCSLLVINSIFKQHQTSYYRQFWGVKGFIAEGECSLKCMDNVNKIVNKVYRQNMRRMFSCWFNNVFSSRKAQKITQSVIASNCEQRTKFKIFAKLDQVYNIEQFKLLKVYDKVKFVFQLKFKFMRKDTHVAITRWWNKTTHYKRRVNGLRLVDKVLKKMAKGVAIQKWRHFLIKTKKQEISNIQSQQITKIKNMSYAMNRLESLKFDQEQSKVRLFYKRHDLLNKVRNKHSYMERINKILNVLHHQHQKNQLRSAFYIYRSKCLKLKAIDTEQNFKITKKQGQITKKVFKNTLTQKGNLRKKLLISFLGRYLSNKDLFYNNRIQNILTKWERNTMNINSSTKGALRRTKLGVFTLLINNGIKNKYRISPQQIQLLKSKTIQLDTKQQQKLQDIQQLLKSHRTINILKLSRMFQNKLYLNKIQLFKILTTIKSNQMKNANMMNLLNRVIKTHILQKGLFNIKLYSQNIKIDNIHSLKLHKYNINKQRLTQQIIFGRWKQYYMKLKKIESFIQRFNELIKINNTKIGFRQIRYYLLASSQNKSNKNIKQLHKQIQIQQTVLVNLSNQCMTLENSAQLSLKKFFQNFNINLLKKTQHQKSRTLKEYLNKWRLNILRINTNEQRLQNFVKRFSLILVRKGFFRIILSSIHSIRQEFKQKINGIRKKDKVNELKIQKGQMAYGNQLQKQRQANIMITKQLAMKQTKFNKYLNSHQQYYSQLHKKVMIYDCWRTWKKIIQNKQFLNNILCFWETKKKRQAFKNISQLARSNNNKNNRLILLFKAAEEYNMNRLKQTYQEWRRQTQNQGVNKMKQQSDKLSQTIKEREETNNYVKQLHQNFVITTNIRQNIHKIFKEWKSQTQKQKIINIKHSILHQKKCEVLFRNTLNRLCEQTNFKQKQKFLLTQLQKSNKNKLKKVMNHFNSNIKIIKKTVLLISNKISHAQTNNSLYSLSVLEKAAEYKNLAFTYQKKKTAFRLMKSLITQSNLNQQKVVYRFLNYQKTYHYLPNILYQHQKKLIQTSFYKLKEVGYFNQKLIIKQADSIMENQKYLINMQMRQMALEKIDGGQLKSYLNERIENDATKMKAAICKLRLQGGKKRLIKCWNSWVEKIKYRNLIKNKLQTIIEFTDSPSKLWMRWKRTKVNLTTFPINLSRNQLISKHNQLQKLSDQYRRQLFQMRGQITQLRFLNNSQQQKITITSKICLNRLSERFNEGLSSVIKLWKQRVNKKVNKQKKYDSLTQHIQNLLNKRSSLMQKISQVNNSNVTLRQNCKQGGAQIQQLKNLLIQKQNLSISLADKKHNIKILLQDNVKIKQKLKHAQQQATKLVHDFQPLMDRTNLY